MATVVQCELTISEYLKYNFLSFLVAAHHDVLKGCTCVLPALRRPASLGKASEICPAAFRSQVL
eukprot:1323438-Amorphochlora_amoeboformis.AAC.2